VLVAVDGHVALLHALQQARLGLRRGAVDLVDQDDVGEDRPRMELEAALALVVDVGADDVGRQEIGRALHPRVVGVQGACQRPRERRLADPGVVLDEDVTLGKQRDQEIADHALVDLDRERDVRRQPRSRLRHGGGIKLRNRRHGSMVRSESRQASCGVCRGTPRRPLS
jgi:hypothetical protein